MGTGSSSADSTADSILALSLGVQPVSGQAWQMISNIMGLRSSSADSSADSILALSLGGQPVSGQAWQMISNIMGTELLLCRLHCRLHPGSVSGGTTSLRAGMADDL